LCSPIVSWSWWRGHHRYLLKSEAWVINSVRTKMYIRVIN
jgi:hypothetical protein